MASTEFDKLVHELSDLRLPHKLKQYRQLQERIKCLTGQVDESKIDVLLGQLNNAVLCGVSQCFICGNDNGSTFPAVVRSSSALPSATITAPGGNGNGSVTGNHYARSLSSQSSVRHHPPVNTSGYLFNSQTSWHNGLASSTGSASPQPDSIDSDSSNVALNADSDSAPDTVSLTTDKDCDPNTSVKNGLFFLLPLSHKSKIKTIFAFSNLPFFLIILENNKESLVLEKEMSDMEISEKDVKSETIIERPVTPSKSSMNEQTQTQTETQSPSPTPQPQQQCNNHSTATSNGRALSKSPGPPPVSPKPARKTILTSPTPASIVLGSNKGSYKAYKDFIANYSKVAKE